MAKIRGVKLEQKHIEQMKGKLRDVDRAECIGLGIDPDTALDLSFNHSQLAWAGLKEDSEAFIAFGVGKAPGSLLQTSGIVWMLATDRVDAEKDILKALGRRSIKYIRKMKKDFDVLFNYVSVDNIIAIKWLEWLGFTFGDAYPMGSNGELYKYFELR